MTRWVCSKAWRCADRYNEKFTEFSRAVKNVQISGNEYLTSIGVGQCSLVVGSPYKTLCANATVVFHLYLIINMLHDLAQAML